LARVEDEGRPGSVKAYSIAKIEELAGKYLNKK
jgi:hypothetical protein